VSNDLWMDGPDDIANAPLPKRRQHDAPIGDPARHIGCPIWWLHRVLPIVKSKNQLVVAIYLWRRRAVCGNHKTFAVPNSELKSLGISRRTKYQTLALLEAADVIRTKRKGKEALTVTILSKEPKA
jgi:hypothetical protein